MDGFRQNAAAQGAEAETLLTAAKSDFEMAKRQSIIYGLYSRSYKSVLVRHIVTHRSP